MSNTATYSDHRVIGSCSICGGKVVVFSGAWYGTNPPKPYCQKCHATRKDPERENVIPMEAGSFGGKK